MATQSFIFKHEDTICAAQEAVRELREALSIEQSKAAYDGACYQENDDTYGTLGVNLELLAESCRKLAEQIAQARAVCTNGCK